MFFRKLYIILKDLSIDTPHGYVHRKKKFHPSVTCMGGPTPNSFFYYLVSYFCSGSYNTYSHQISSLQYLQFPSKSAVTDGQTDRRTDGHDETIRVPFLPFWLRNPKNQIKDSQLRATCRNLRFLNRDLVSNLDLRNVNPYKIWH